MEYWIEFVVKIMKDLASIADVLAWPIVTLVLGIKFRTEIAQLLTRVSKIRSGDHEIEFENQIRNTAEKAEAIPAPAEPAKIDEQLTSEWPDLAPLGVIVETWLLVEKRVFELGAARGVHTSDSRRKTAYQVTLRLAEVGAIDGSVQSTVRYLRDARNTAVHDPDVSVRRDDALEYKYAAERVIAVIEAELKNTGEGST